MADRDFIEILHGHLLSVCDGTDITVQYKFATFVCGYHGDPRNWTSIWGGLFQWRCGRLGSASGPPVGWSSGLPSVTDNVNVHQLAAMIQKPEVVAELSLGQTDREDLLASLRLLISDNLSPRGEPGISALQPGDTVYSSMRLEGPPAARRKLVHIRAALVLADPPCMAWVVVSDVGFAPNPWGDATCEKYRARCTNKDNVEKDIVFLRLSAPSFSKEPQGPSNIQWCLNGTRFDVEVLRSALMHRRAQVDEVLRRAQADSHEKGMYACAA